MAEDRFSTTDDEPREGGGPSMSFLEHLEDLRWTLVKCAIALVTSLVICLFVCDKLAQVLEWPIRNMNLLEKDQPTVTLFIGQKRLGPYQVTPEGLPGLPATGTPHLVYRLELSGTGDGDLSTAAFKLDPKAEPGTSQVQLKNLNPAEGFMVAFDISLYFAMAISAPFWLYFIAQYLGPALRAKEKKLLRTWLGWGSVLFLAGVGLTFFILLPLSLRASIQYSNLLGFDPYDWRADEYIGFTGKFMFGMGIGFQLPIITLALVKIGILNYRTLAHYRRHVIVVSLILGALLTTPEVLTQVAMAVPLCLLYEACIWIAWYWERKKRKEEKAEQYQSPYSDAGR